MPGVVVSASEDGYIKPVARADIVKACGTIQKCVNQLSLTLHKLGEVGRGGVELPPGESLASELDRQMAELDDKIGQILSAVRKIGHDLRQQDQPCGERPEA